MPNVYRAPEVILGLPWGYLVDVWGFGMVESLPIWRIWSLVLLNHHIHGASRGERYI